MKRETISRALNGLDDSFITEAAAFRPEAMQGTPERTIQMKTKRIISVTLAAVLILALGITASAIAGILRSTGKHEMPKTADYTSLSDIPRVEKDVGYPITALERFSNGYGFAGLRVEGEAVYGEDNEVLKDFYGVCMTYSKPGEKDLYLELSPVLELPDGAEAPEPNERRTVNGIDVGLILDHYKLVPEGYEKTEEDRMLEAAGHYYITFGPDEIMECNYAFAGFELNGVSYMLMDMDASVGSLDTLAQMAEELITAAKA